MTVFPPQEFARRRAALQAGMADRGQDALLLTSPADVFYVTGFLTRFWESPARPWFVVLPRTGGPVAVIPDIGVDLMSTCRVAEIRSWPAPDPVDDGVTLLAGTLADLVPETGAIGLPMGLETSLRMPVADFDRLCRALAPRRMVDATETVQRVREIKSELEIDAIRAACAVADRAFGRVPDIVAGAGSLAVVFRRFQAALLDEGADWVSYLAGGAGPDGYGNVIAPAGPAPLQPGDILMLDTGAVKDGYFCDFDRNFAVGPPGDTARRAYDVLHATTEAALAQFRPGMTAADAHRVMVGAIRAAGGIPAGGRLGHGLGVTLTEWPSFTDRDRTELRAGMVLTIEPGVVSAEGRIMVQEENIVLRADGPELLSRRAPLQMVEIAP